jgi:DNA-directed RNA polymerase specialized sigma24 family protein
MLVSDCPERPNPIDPATAELIRRKSLQLVRKARVSQSDCEDIAQDLSITMLRGLAVFDPAKRERDIFIRMILAHGAASISRRLKKRSIVTTDGVETLADPRANDTALVLADFLATLPEDLRHVAELLGSESIAGIARRLKISRSTVYRRLEEVRARLTQSGF